MNVLKAVYQCKLQQINWKFIQDHSSEKQAETELNRTSWNISIENEILH